MSRLVTAVVFPADEAALRAAVAAARERSIVPLLIGRRGEIRDLALREGIDLGGCEIVDAADEREAAARAVELVVAGKAEALMKGSLHSDVLLHAVMREPKLHTERRMSHVYLVQIPHQSHPLILTDTVVNVAPTLEDKADITRNAIDFANLLGLPGPRVAILSALETVSAKIPSTIEAAAIAKMADRGQIRGGIVDGPLALDDAIDPHAAELKKIASPVAGRANVLVVPDLEAGNIMAKELEFIGHAQVAGIVVGARVPIILTSRAETVRARVASCALAARYATAMADQSFSGVSGGSRNSTP